MNICNILRSDGKNNAWSVQKIKDASLRDIWNELWDRLYLVDPKAKQLDFNQLILNYQPPSLRVVGDDDGRRRRKGRNRYKFDTDLSFFESDDE